MSRSQHRRLSCQINFGLTQDQAEQIAAAAHAAGVSRATFARRHVLAAIGQPDTTPARAGLPPNEVIAVTALAASVGRTAGATIQLAQALRLAGHKGFHALAENVLADLRARALDLASVIERLR